MSRNDFFLKPSAPFRLDRTVWTLRRRPTNRFDRWDGETYSRTLIIADEPVEIFVIQADRRGSPRLRATVRGAAMTSTIKQAVTAALDRLLGLRTDLAPFYDMASRDVDLAPLVSRFLGMKPPQFLSVFEGIVNAIACQQVTLTLGIQLLNRLAQHYGPQRVGIEGLAFPQPGDLVASSPEAFRALGYSRQKGRAMIELAEQCLTGPDDLEALRTQPDERVVTRLLQLHGVGRWTAEYVMLRCLGRFHIFPGDDVGARNNLRRWLKFEEPLDYVGTGRAVARWQPFSGLVYFHLLLDRLSEAGYMQA